MGRDTTSGLDGPCTSVTYSGPDGNNVPISGQCVDVAGNVGFRWFSIDYDGTGPQVAATASRGPDVNGWYNHSLEVDFTGSDAVSGLESCAPPENYSGPDSGFAVVGGICLDKAGNAGVASYALQYDATAPQVTGASPARLPDSNGWYNQPLDVGFQGTDATSAIETCTRARYGGPDAAATSVSGFCRDRAGNRSSDSSFALRYDSTAPSLTAVTAKAGDRKAVLTWTASPDTTFVEIHRAGTLVYRGHERELHRRPAEERHEVPLHADWLRRGAQRRDGQHCGDSDGAAGIASCRRHGDGAAPPSLDPRPEGHALQRPGLAQGQDLQLLAEGNVDPH